MKFHIGCSGWSYKEWKPGFYPKNIPANKWFEHYSTIFNTVELNNSFYRLPKEEMVEGWKKRAPKHFCFSVKASRLITHYKRLQDVEEALAAFFQRIDLFGKKLGPILYQLPAKFALDYTLLENFLKMLPRGYSHVFEFRHPSWWIGEVFELLDKYRAGFCVYHMEDTKTPIVVTGNICYMRFHGPIKRYRGSYTNRQLASYARKMMASGVDAAWVYFNNSADGSAYLDAQRLQKIVEKL